MAHASDWKEAGDGGGRVTASSTMSWEHNSMYHFIQQLEDMEAFCGVQSLDVVQEQRNMLLTEIQFHPSVHGFRTGKGTGTATLEVAHTPRPNNAYLTV